VLQECLRAVVTCPCMNCLGCVCQECGVALGVQHTCSCCCCSHSLCGQMQLRCMQLFGKRGLKRHVCGLPLWHAAFHSVCFTKKTKGLPTGQASNSSVRSRLFRSRFLELLLVERHMYMLAAVAKQGGSTGAGIACCFF
jgi:hypothetical protein